jgi:hypothetical protein
MGDQGNSGGTGMVGIIKMEVVEGTPDIVYRNPYEEVVVAAGDLNVLQRSLFSTGFVIKPNETLSIAKGKILYLAVPDRG